PNRQPPAAPNPGTNQPRPRRHDRANREKGAAPRRPGRKQTRPTANCESRQVAPAAGPQADLNNKLLTPAQWECVRLLALGPRNSARPVDARAQIVDELSRGTSLPRDFRDAWVKRGLAYVRARRACRTDADRLRLAREAPDLDAAYRLREAGDKVARGAVEGRLLAGQTAEEVAAACGFAPEAV